MTVLLDGNVLIAVTLSGHVHHRAVSRWMAALAEPFATTPITQGTLLRTMIRMGATADEAFELLEHLTRSDSHQFWTDDLPYTRQVMENVTGHAAVTDAYLAALARHQGARVATVDREFAVLFPNVVERIDTD